MGDDLDAEGFLQTSTGKRVPKLSFTPSLLLEKTCVLYGPSKTGKSVIVKDIMKTLNGFIEQIIVVCPTEPSNRSYEGFVDSPFIHYRIYIPDPSNTKKDDGKKGALRFLDTLWARQEMMAAIYNRANNAEFLAELFGRIPKASRAEGLEYIKEINEKRAKVIDSLRKKYSSGESIGVREVKIKEVNEKFKSMLILLYKKYITPHVDMLYECADLSEDERYSLCYLDFNPRMLLIFDDCAAQLKPFFATEVFRKLFYQNRHSFITAVICCQDDTDLVANLRKSAFISIFTEPIVCVSNFTRAANNFPKNQRQYVSEIAPEVFVGHRKMAYIREDDRGHHWYHITCPFPRKFLFGGVASHELCKTVQLVGASMDKENPFYDKFKLGE